LPIPSSSPLKPKGIIPVDLFGLTADYNAIQAVTEKYDLAVIEDAAQSFGAEYRGKKACSFGNIACTSFFPAKPLGCYGDGGMCFTNDDGAAEIMDSIRVHGKGNHKYENVRIGINGRLDLWAAILRKLEFSQKNRTPPESGWWLCPNNAGIIGYSPYIPSG
jgi:dTDP-4-amino-4,6-dideoxygalactose transaminase